MERVDVDMKGTGRINSARLSPREATADVAAGHGPARNAERYLSLRDGLGLDPAPGSFPAPFTRDTGAAISSADAIMAKIRVVGAPDAPEMRLQPDTGRFRQRRHVFRIASLAAAAVVIAALSSILTLNMMRTDATVDVRFVLVAPEASSVHLAADFNQWSPDGYDMVKKQDGSWEITVPLRKGRAYAYNFIIDGERWIADPTGALLLDDGFGGSSSSISL